MKEILVTGCNYSIGASLEKNINNQYQIDTTEMIDGSWRV